MTTQSPHTSSRVHRPGSTLPSATSPGNPGRPHRTASPRYARSWKETPMPRQPKPQQTEDEREQARRALQTSMDTRQ